jgi:uncharacterized repeat protein (TIGR01451 family)
LAVIISADRSSYEEQQIITYTISYSNNANVNAEDVEVKAKIPEFTTISDSNGGTVKDRSIVWTIGNSCC